MSEVEKYFREVREPDCDDDWSIIENADLIDQLIRHWEASKLPSVIMGPPGVGKTLGTMLSVLIFLR